MAACGHGASPAAVTGDAFVEARYSRSPMSYNKAESPTQPDAPPTEPRHKRQDSEACVLDFKAQFWEGARLQRRGVLQDHLVGLAAQPEHLHHLEAFGFALPLWH